MIFKCMLVALVFSISSMQSARATLPINGVLQQGGFIFGQVQPGAKVQLGKITTRLDAAGHFFAPIPRKAPAELQLTITNPQEGTVQQRILKITPQSYDIEYIEGVSRNKVHPNPVESNHVRTDKAQILAARQTFRADTAFRQPFIAPLEYTRISGVYGSERVFNGVSRSWHKGVDFTAPTGTAVWAPAGAKVALALADSFLNGHLIILDHGHQVYTIYAHLHKMVVKAGDRVKQGDKIGEVGSTGRSTGPHLHWGLYWRQMALDPRLLLEKGEIQ